LLGAGVLIYFLLKDTSNSPTQIQTDKRPPFPKEFLQDKDQDGLSADQEATLGTSDEDTDTDGDGLSDFKEVNETKTNPLKIDTDDDGFADYIEILNGHDPNA